jgi:integrase
MVTSGQVSGHRGKLIVSRTSAGRSPAWGFEQINLTARVSGNDAVLDALLLRLHTETACRCARALALQLHDLDTDRCLIQLREKGNTVRRQTITAALANCLMDHATSRGAVLSTDPYVASVTADHSPVAVTTNSGNASVTDSPGSPPKASPPTGSATPPGLHPGCGTRGYAAWVSIAGVGSRLFT